MALKRRVTTNAYDDIASVKRHQRPHDFSETQDIWENLNRVRSNVMHSEVNKKNSRLYIPIFTEHCIENAKHSVEALREYIQSSKIQFHMTKKGGKCAGFVSLKDFNLLDCCLVLSVIFASRNRNLTTATTEEFFTIPGNIVLAGSFYLPSNCTFLNNVCITTSVLKIIEAKYTEISNFREFHISLAKNESLTHFIQGSSSLFAPLKFGKCKNTIDRDFRSCFSKHLQYLRLSIFQAYLPKGLLFDIEDLININRPEIVKSEENLLKYVQDLSKHNGLGGLKKPTFEPSSTEVQADPDIQDRQRTLDGVPNNKRTRFTATFSKLSTTEALNSRDRRMGEVSSANPSVSSSYMTQEQIKQHCQATIKASMDALKSKSPYQIFTMYVKFPRQKYIDMIYQSLNDLRAQSNCNIVVLNLNNINESTSWFDKLDTSKYTTFTRAPHPSTVRVVSIGGLGEHMIKALGLISKIMDS